MRKIAGAVAATGAVLVTLFVAPTAAHAATCHAFTCTYKDPQATGCAADAITAKSKVSLGRTVELRYSPTCRSAWARIRNGAEGDYARIRNTAGHDAADRIGAGATSVYTVMVNDAGLQAWACLMNSGNGCTDRY
jgi:Protein of unknown function (DUF2690)